MNRRFRGQRWVELGEEGRGIGSGRTALECAAEPRLGENQTGEMFGLDAEPVEGMDDREPALQLRLGRRLLRAELWEHECVQPRRERQCC